VELLKLQNKVYISGLGRTVAEEDLNNEQVPVKVPGAGLSTGFESLDGWKHSLKSN
jgi:hypothetical protein